MSAHKIFISYRRHGTDGNSANLLYKELQAEFGADEIFLDVDSIRPGTDFVALLEEVLEHCAAVVVVIGPSWLNQVERLHDGHDFVRTEIEAALNRPGIPVIPLLVDGAQMPSPEALPAPIRSLVRRSGIQALQQVFALIVKNQLVPELHRAVDEAKTRVTSTRRKHDPAVTAPPSATPRSKSSASLARPKSMMPSIANVRIPRLKISLLNILKQRTLRLFAIIVAAIILITTYVTSLNVEKSSAPVADIISTQQGRFDEYQYCDDNFTRDLVSCEAIQTPADASECVRRAHISLAECQNLVDEEAARRRELKR